MNNYQWGFANHSAQQTLATAHDVAGRLATWITGACLSCCAHNTRGKQQGWAIVGKHLLQVGRLLVIGHVKELRLECTTEGYNGLSAMLFDPLEDLHTHQHQSAPEARNASAIMRAGLLLCPFTLIWL